MCFKLWRWGYIISAEEGGYWRDAYWTWNAARTRWAFRRFVARGCRGWSMLLHDVGIHDERAVRQDQALADFFGD